MRRSPSEIDAVAQEKTQEKTPFRHRRRHRIFESDAATAFSADQPENGKRLRLRQGSRNGCAKAHETGETRCRLPRCGYVNPRPPPGAHEAEEDAALLVAREEEVRDQGEGGGDEEEGQDNRHDDDEQAQDREDS